MLKIEYAHRVQYSLDSGGDIDICANWQVLDVWLGTGRTLEYTTYAVDSCLDVDTLNWWRTTGRNLEFKYGERVLNAAATVGNMEVLEWWKNSGLQIECCYPVFSNASEFGHINVLRWLSENGFRLTENEKYFKFPLQFQYSLGISIDILNWWRGHVAESEWYSEFIMDMASWINRVDILEWVLRWSKLRGVPMKFSHLSIELSFFSGAVEAFEWWMRQSEVELKTSAVGEALVVDFLTPRIRGTRRIDVDIESLDHFLCRDSVEEILREYTPRTWTMWVDDYDPLIDLSHTPLDDNTVCKMMHTAARSQHFQHFRRYLDACEEGANKFGWQTVKKLVNRFRNT